MKNDERMKANAAMNSWDRRKPTAEDLRLIKESLAPFPNLPGEVADTSLPRRYFVLIEETRSRASGGGAAAKADNLRETLLRAVHAIENGANLHDWVFRVAITDDDLGKLASKRARRGKAGCGKNEATNVTLRVARS